MRSPRDPGVNYCYGIFWYRTLLPLFHSALPYNIDLNSAVDIFYWCLKHSGVKRPTLIHIMHIARQNRHIAHTLRGGIKQMPFFPHSCKHKLNMDTLAHPVAYNVRDKRNTELCCGVYSSILIIIFYNKPLHKRIFWSNMGKSYL